MQKITTFLWYDNQALEAAEFYVSIFPNSKINLEARFPEGSPGEAGSVMVVPFVLDGVEFLAMNGGPMFKFTPAISLAVQVKSQDELDDIWDKLTADGGEPGYCGWLTDKYGLSWQVVPDIIGECMTDSNPAKSKAAMDAVMQMRKLDIAAIKAAFDGA